MSRIQSRLEFDVVKLIMVRVRLPGKGNLNCSGPVLVVVVGNVFSKGSGTSRNKASMNSK